MKDICHSKTKRWKHRYWSVYLQNGKFGFTRWLAPYVPRRNDKQWSAAVEALMLVHVVTGRIAYEYGDAFRLLCYWNTKAKHEVAAKTVH